MAETNIKFDNRWISCFKNDASQTYYSDALNVGGTNDYHSLVGFDVNGIVDAMSKSTTTPSVTVHIYTSDVGPFDLGVHATSSAKTTNGLPWYKWTGKSYTPTTQGTYYSYNITDVVNAEFPTNKGLVFYQSPTADYAYYSQCYIRVHGTWDNTNIKIAGTWRKARTWIRAGGIWNEAKEVWIKAGGVWRKGK